MDGNNFLPQLSQNLLEILSDDEYYDINIEVGNDSCVQVFRAHMNILNYRSPYLKRIFSTNKKKNDGTLTHIKLPNTLPEIFQIILRYIYGGKLSLEARDASDIIKILITANELSLQELVGYLQSFLIRYKKNWMEQNFDLIYQTSFENDSFLELQKYCIEFVTYCPDKIFNISNFSSIPEKLLISLVQSENLQMSEIQIWDHVLNWGFAQNSELPSDPLNFSKDDFNILKNTIQKCISFVRFYNLTSKEFSDKVLPYKKVLPKELYKDLLHSFLNICPDGKLSDKLKPRVAEEIPESIAFRLIGEKKQKRRKQEMREKKKREQEEQEEQEQERSEQERSEQERSEQERSEQERSEQEKIERIEQERREQERREQERSEQERREELERKKQERRNQERRKQERRDQERRNQERRDQERRNQERRDQERREQEELEREKQERREQKRRKQETRGQERREQRTRKEKSRKERTRKNVKNVW